jgi:hypothetical protein
MPPAYRAGEQRSYRRRVAGGAFGVNVDRLEQRQPGRSEPDHVHVERLGKLRQPAADATQADDQQRPGRSA